MTAAHLPRTDRGHRPAKPSLRAHTGGRADRSAGRPVPDLPAPGTRVLLVGQDRHGEVMLYDRRFSHGSFPVRFDDGQWRIMLPSDLEQG